MAALSSIDLTFDESTEAAVRGEWDALERAGFSSLGAHTATTNRPHLTLVAAAPLELVRRPAAPPLPHEDPAGGAVRRHFSTVFSAPNARSPGPGGSSADALRGPGMGR